MEATDRLIDIIQDNAQYENFITELALFVKGLGGKPSFIALNNTTLEDMMSSIIDGVEALKKKAG